MQLESGHRPTFGVIPKNRGMLTDFSARNYYIVLVIFLCVLGSYTRKLLLYRIDDLNVL